MRIIAADDEALMLDMLTDRIRQAWSPGGNPSLFQCPSAAGVAGGDWRGL